MPGPTPVPEDQVMCNSNRVNFYSFFYIDFLELHSRTPPLARVFCISQNFSPPYSRPAGFATGGRSARGYGNPILDKSVDQPYQSMCRRLLFRSEKDESRTRTPKGQTVYLRGTSIQSL
jgi:hypothetical protein